VPLCGHATLASAAVVFQGALRLLRLLRLLHGPSAWAQCGRAMHQTPRAHASPAAKQCLHDELHFETAGAGTLSVRRVRQGSSDLLIQMSLPLYDPLERPPAGIAGPGSALVAACTGGLPLKEARWGRQGGGALGQQILSAN
jgi:hypothetical protein